MCPGRAPGPLRVSSMRSRSASAGATKQREHARTPNGPVHQPRGTLPHRRQPQALLSTQRPSPVAVGCIAETCWASSTGMRPAAFGCCWVLLGQRPAAVTTRRVPGGPLVGANTASRRGSHRHMTGNDHRSSDQYPHDLTHRPVRPVHRPGRHHRTRCGRPDHRLAPRRPRRRPTGDRPGRRIRVATRAATRPDLHPPGRDRRRLRRRPASARRGHGRFPLVPGRRPARRTRRPGHHHRSGQPRHRALAPTDLDSNGGQRRGPVHRLPTDHERRHLRDRGRQLRRAGPARHRLRGAPRRTPAGGAGRRADPRPGDRGRQRCRGRRPVPVLRDPCGGRRGPSRR